MTMALLFGLVHTDTVNVSPFTDHKKQLKEAETMY